MSKCTIYYFSGTGNSYYTAKRLAELIEDTEIVPLAKLTRSVVDCKSNMVGFVFPVYLGQPPEIVVNFINKLVIHDDTYYFAVETCNGQPSVSLSVFKDAFTKKGGRLFYANYIPTVGNCIYGYEIKEEERRRRLEFAEQKLVKIASEINVLSTTRIPKRTVAKLFSISLEKAKPNFDHKFTVSDDCNGCSICQKVCPVNNIEIKKGKPHWKNQCEMCLGCINWCPKTAIEYGKKTKGRLRYHHPEVEYKELM